MQSFRRCWLRFCFLVVCGRSPSLCNRFSLRSSPYKFQRSSFWLLPSALSRCAFSILSTCHTTLSGFFRLMILSARCFFRGCCTLNSTSGGQEIKEAVEGFCHENTCRVILTFPNISPQKLCFVWIIWMQFLCCFQSLNQEDFLKPVQCQKKVSATERPSYVRGSHSLIQQVFHFIAHCFHIEGTGRFYLNFIQSINAL